MERRITQPNLGLPPYPSHDMFNLREPGSKAGAVSIANHDNLQAVEAQFSQLKINKSGVLLNNLEPKKNTLPNFISDLFKARPNCKPLKFNARSESCPITPIPLILPSHIKVVKNHDGVQVLANNLSNK